VSLQHNTYFNCLTPKRLPYLKVTIILEQAMTAERGIISITILSLSLALDVLGLDPTNRPIYTRDTLPVVQEAG
jgi:hypothetical protein